VRRLPPNHPTLRFRDPPTPKIAITYKKRRVCHARMDEGRKRVIGVMAAILASLHIRNADDLFGGPQREPENGQVDSGEHSVGGEDHGED